MKHCPTHAFRFAICLGLILTNVGIAQKKKNDAVTDASKADADFKVQGEYVGKLPLDDGTTKAFGVQVIALGGGKFRAVAYPGGLPGEGWTGKEKHKAEGQTKESVTQFKLPCGEVSIKDEVMTILPNKATFKKVMRKSKTLGMKPPEGAIILFDGKTNNFAPGKTTEDGLLMVPQRSKHVFKKDFTLHIEFRTPYKPYARGQGRGNSGAYIQGRYEVQVLDSFGLEGKRNECGGLYGRKDCDVNACFPPLSWQTYDIDFTVARFDEKGKQTAPAMITVRHNNIVVHDQVKLRGANKNGGTLNLQNHGNPVHYRNIWVLERSAKP